MLNEVFMVLPPLLWLASFAARSALDTTVSSSDRTQVLQPGHLGKMETRPSGQAVHFPKALLGEIIVTIKDIPSPPPPPSGFSH